MIRDDWIRRAIDAPEHEAIQADGRIRRWATIPEAEGRRLRVVLMPDAATVHNAFFRQIIQAMKITYFQDTDTLHIEFRTATVAETRELDENTLLDIDSQGNLCGLTLEHARDRADIRRVDFEQVAA
jgi:uncharacterized protein YuzE